MFRGVQVKKAEGGSEIAIHASFQPQESSHCFKILASDVSRFSLGVLCNRMGMGIRDEGCFDLTSEEKKLDSHLLLAMRENPTVQSLGQVGNQAQDIAESLVLFCPMW